VCILIYWSIPTEVSQSGGGVDDVLWHIEDRLLGDSLGEDGGLGDVEIHQKKMLIINQTNIR